MYRMSSIRSNVISRHLSYTRIIVTLLSGEKENGEKLLKIIHQLI